MLSDLLVCVTFQLLDGDSLKIIIGERVKKAIQLIGKFRGELRRRASVNDSVDAVRRRLITLEFVENRLATYESTSALSSQVMPHLIDRFSFGHHDEDCPQILPIVKFGESIRSNPPTEAGESRDNHIFLVRHSPWA